MGMFRWIAPALFVTLVLVTGCDNTARQPAAPKTYSVRGKVLEVDAKKQEILLQHEAVPGFMEAMTMPYKVADPAAINELHANDKITATIVVMNSGVDLHDVVITGQADPNALPKSQYHVPQPGDAVPDFRLTNQSARQIHLSQYRGKVLLMTFIYTRCPLDDFCPRMSRNFAEIEHQIVSDKDLSQKTHLLSVSFDTAYDKPAVLRSYGEAYTGNYNKERFEHWDFAAPDAQTLAKMTQFFDVGVTGSDPQSIVHSLSTVIIGPDGRVIEWLPTNDWKPSDVLATMRKAAAQIRAKA
jgi:protein SCO1/2